MGGYIGLFLFCFYYNKRIKILVIIVRVYLRFLWVKIKNKIKNICLVSCCLNMDEDGYSSFWMCYYYWLGLMVSIENKKFGKFFGLFFYWFIIGYF